MSILINYFYFILFFLFEKFIFLYQDQKSGLCLTFWLMSKRVGYIFISYNPSLSDTNLFFSILFNTFKWALTYNTQTAVRQFHIKNFNMKKQQQFRYNNTKWNEIKRVMKYRKTWFKKTLKKREIYNFREIFFKEKFLNIFES